jgi:hypothetical protein
LEWLNNAFDTSLTEEQRAPFMDFRNAVETAQAIAEQNALNNLLFHGATDPRAWQANAWFLERRNNDAWGKKDKLQIEGQMTLTELISGSVKREQQAREIEAKIVRDDEGEDLDEEIRQLPSAETNGTG